MPVAGVLTPAGEAEVEVGTGQVIVEEEGDVMGDVVEGISFDYEKTMYKDCEFGELCGG